MPPDSCWILLVLDRCLLLTKNEVMLRNTRMCFSQEQSRWGQAQETKDFSSRTHVALSFSLPTWSWSSPRSSLGPFQNSWPLARGSVQMGDDH